MRRILAMYCNYHCYSGRRRDSDQDLQEEVKSGKAEVS